MARGALEAHKPPDQRVVAAVRRVTVLVAKARVETLLGIGDRRVDGNAELAESRRTDRDEQRLDGHFSAREIASACFDEVVSREDACVELHAVNGNARLRFVTHSAQTSP